MPTPARSARGHARRAQILDVAAELFASPGYHVTSLRDIAAAAGITHAGLLRHYASKAEILRGVFDRVSPVMPDTDRVTADGDIASLLSYAAELPRKPQLVTLIATAYASASEPSHPLHDYMFGRLNHRMKVGIAHLSNRADLGVGRDPVVEARLFSAVWDGLQLLMLFAPELVDFPAQVHRFYQDMAHDRALPSVGVLAPPAVPATDVPSTSRERILSAALTQFAHDGYAESTMRSIAAAAGVAKSTLFHHFASKEDILREALAFRDGETGANLLTIAQRDARGALLLVAHRAADTARARVETAAYTLLSHESAPQGHPEHEYFAERFRTFFGLLHAVMVAARAEGSLPEDRDPAHEATLLTAMWTGAQLQHLYEPDVVDPAALLEDHLRGLLRG